METKPTLGSWFNDKYIPYLDETAELGRKIIWAYDLISKILTNSTSLGGNAPEGGADSLLGSKRDKNELERSIV